MSHIDKQKFGTFIAMLRKEKGYTQKELAKQLFISDKAVSKWETAASVPNIDLLIPLADLLGVTVTELLMCERVEQDSALNTSQVEQVVKAAVSYSDGAQTRAYHTKSKWGLIYILSFMTACLEILCSYRYGCITNGLIISAILGASFGIYFCFFVKERLPAYYDENHICVYTDGLFEMNLPGISINNHNWGKILKAGRIWAVSLMLGYPVISYIEGLVFSGIWLMAVDLLLSLFLILGGFFIPIYAVGKNMNKDSFQTR